MVSCNGATDLNVLGMVTTASLIDAALHGAAVAALCRALCLTVLGGEVATSALVYPGDLELGAVPAAVGVPGEALRSGYCSGNSNKCREVRRF